MPRYCLTLDLLPDPKLIAEYVEHHRVGRREIRQSICDAGILNMQIYHLNERLFMIMDTSDDFTFERKAVMDKANPDVQAWERLMSRYQNVDAESDPSARWQPMKKIFDLL